MEETKKITAGKITISDQAAVEEGIKMQTE